MIGSRRTLLTAFVGLAAATVTAPVFASDANIPLQLADARARRRISSASASGSIRRRSQSAICAARWCWSISGLTAATTASTRSPM